MTFDEKWISNLVFGFIFNSSLLLIFFLLITANSILFLNSVPSSFFITKPES